VITEAGTPNCFSSRANSAWCIFIWAAPFRQPSARQHLVRHFEEVLREEALSAVDVDDALIEDEIGRGGRLKLASQGSNAPVLRQLAWPNAAAGAAVSRIAANAQTVRLACILCFHRTSSATLGYRRAETTLAG
jgi:hypothetical protein